MSGFLQLDPIYGHTITVLRQTLSKPSKRARGVFSIFVVAPVTSPVLEVAIDPLSLYVLGFRRQSEKTWWEFKPTGKLPQLDNAKPLACGSADYTNLGLEKLINKTVSITPNLLVTRLAYLNGTHIDDDDKWKLLLLIFLVSEALRFDTVKYAGKAYVANADLYFNNRDSPEYYKRNPGDLVGHSFTFTRALVEMVRDWRKHTQSNHNDLGLPWVPGG